MPDDSGANADSGPQPAPPPSLYCNLQFQDVFEPFDFDERRMNVHMKKFASDRRIVVFVHGFNGCGYSTWEKFPEILASRGVVPWTMTFGL
jgi:hypothetical protein